jgi:hypothetical protein
MSVNSELIQAAALSDWVYARDSGDPANPGTSGDQNRGQSEIAGGNRGQSRNRGQTPIEQHAFKVADRNS